MNWRKGEFKQRKNDSQIQLWGSAAKEKPSKVPKTPKEPIHEYRPQAKPKKPSETEKLRQTHRKRKRTHHPAKICNRNSPSKSLSCAHTK